MNWLESGIGLVALVGAFLLAQGIKAIFEWLERRDIRVQDGVKATLALAVQGTWEALVQDLKGKAADGKLTAQEKREARQHAKLLALRLAKGPVLEALRAMVPQALDALISLLVQRAKGH